MLGSSQAVYMSRLCKEILWSWMNGWMLSFIVWWTVTNDDSGNYNLNAIHYSNLKILDDHISREWEFNGIFNNTFLGLIN